MTPENPSPDELLARVSALEERVAAMEAGTSATDREHIPDSGADRERAPGTTSEGSAPTAACGAPATPPTSSAQTPAIDEADPFWALTSLKEHAPAPGAVVFAGAVDVGAGHLEYQWGRPTEHLLATDWAEHAESVAALGHPLRLAMLRRLLDEEHTVAQLVDELELGSTGVAYHHLSALQSGGWVTSPRRGSWALAAPRAVPLLAIITALEKG
ncbi:MAG: helix-turn-helix domain-containing protein [Brachybacterium sp.]|nr:helix-turn-helix domain-containing protein [Brachybacterium sp.]MDN5688902.1 helix-turn-helix domain-containing protein [Brachybacterium sp.]